MIKKNVLFAGAMAGNYLVMLPLFQLFKQRFPRLVDSNTDICIEGYPRSGNTYFVSAFQMWNNNTNIAHHSHLAGNVKFALKQGIPTVVLIRRPQDCVASVLVWDGLLMTSNALLNYLGFYRCLWKHREKLLVLRFEDITQYPGECIQLINNRFGLDFNFEDSNGHVDKQIRARLEKVDDRNKRSVENSTLPNATKLKFKQEYAHRVVSSRIFKNANAVYSAYELLVTRVTAEVSS